MVLLENDVFLTRLNKLFKNSRDAASVTISIKRWDGHTKPTPREGKPPLPTPQENLCLIRAKCRTKKISTVIHQKDLTSFQLQFSNVLKVNTDGLKKLKKPKNKSKQL